MMGREWRAILARYGQEVSVQQDEGTEAVALRAFLQPLRDKGGEQRLPSPLGLRREDRFLYLGPADTPLAAGVSRVSWQGLDYDVQSAHPVGAAAVNHWWAVLRPRDKEGV